MSYNGTYAVLVINPNSSECDGCGEPANLRELAHKTVLGYGPRNGAPGCGRRFIAAATDYDGRYGEACREARPDLPWLGVRLRVSSGV